MSGSDGVGYRTCHVWTAFKIDCRAVVRYWLERALAAKPDGPNMTCESPSMQSERVV
jgi:hypothetical protein